MKNETENLAENLRDNKFSKNTERENNLIVEEVGRKNSVNWNHTDLIPNWNQKYSGSIHIYPNHTKSNQPIPANPTNIGSIHDSDKICEIENLLASSVHSPVHM